MIGIINRKFRVPLLFGALILLLLLQRFGVFDWIISSFQPSNRRSSCKRCSNSKPIIPLSSLGLPKASSSWMTDDIPRIIHQSARNDTSKWHPTWQSCQQSWKTTFPSWEYRLWTDEDIFEFMKTKYPKAYPVFTELSSRIMMFDVVRYFILYEFGGVYADMDYLCLRDFSHLLPKGKVSISESPFGDAEGYQNALMASPARHPYWHYVLSEVLAAKDVDIVYPSTKRKHNRKQKDDSSYSHSNTQFMKAVFEKTGPQMIVRAVRASPSEMFHALPRRQFGPGTHLLIYANNSLLPTIHAADVYTAHLGTCSWCK